MFTQQPSPKRCALSMSPDDDSPIPHLIPDPTPTSSEIMEPQLRRKLMDIVGLVEPASGEAPPMDSNKNEDLLSIQVPEKLEEVIRDANGNRMIIKNIVVENFKSYKGRQELGPLHKNLTMIIGANGSGKSNFIEALLFVFEFDNLTDRFKNLVSCIHKSEDASACESCMVEVHFQEIQDVDSEKYVVNLANSFTIARSAFRDNTSKFFFNGQSKPKQFIQKLLQKLGLDHNRFLILQGEVEQISQMEPISTDRKKKGMMEYIEEIVGSGRYKEAIQKLQDKVKWLEMKISKEIAHCNYIKARSEPLLQAVLITMQYINAQNKKNMIDGLILKHKIAIQTELIKENEKLETERRDKVEDLREQLKELSMKTKETEMVVKKIQAKLGELESRKQTLDKSFDVWNQKDVKIKIENRAHTETIANLESSIRKCDQELEELQKAPACDRTQKNYLLEKLEKLREEKEKFEGKTIPNLNQYEAETKEEKEKSKAYNKSIGEMEEKRIELETDLQEVQMELENIRLDTSEDDAKKLVERKKILEEKTKEKDKLAGALQSKTGELNKTARSIDECQYRMKESTRNAKKYKEEIDDIQAQIERRRSNKGQIICSKGAEYLKKAHLDGKFPGYIGRLGDLARIPEKYEKALSGNYRRELNTILVATCVDCKVGIELLREQKLERERFLDYDRIAKRMIYPLKSANGPPLLFEQLKISNNDERIRQAFYSFLENVPVANDIRNGQEVLKMYRNKNTNCFVTTLDGSLIWPNGNFTGGGSVTTGLIGTTSNGSQGQMEGLVDKQNELKKEYECTKRKVEEVQNKLKEDMKTKEKLTLEVSQLKLKEIYKCQEEKVENAQNSFQELLKKLEIATKGRDSIDENLRNLYQSIVGNDKKELEKVKNEIEKFNLETSRLQAKIEGYPQQMEILEQKKRRLEEELNKRKVGYVDEDNEEHKAEGEQHREALKGIQNEIQTRSNDFKTAQDQLEVARKDFIEIKDSYKTSDLVLQEIPREINDSRMKLHYFQLGIQKIPENWLSRESLEPDGELCLESDPRMKEKGFFVIPKEVMESFEERFQKRFEEAEEEKMDPRNLARMEETREKLENFLESHRYGEQAITHYSIISKLLQNAKLIKENISKELKAHRSKLDELKSSRLKEFSKALEFLGHTTTMIYQFITNGGDASLAFLDTTSPFESGVKFAVRPPFKSWKLIKHLSGGEKTLASLCFVFAIHHLRPTPLYVMDEIDASLDIWNVSKIARYIRNCRNAQFIIVSHHNQMFEFGNRLIGIYKTDGSTKHVIVSPKAIEKGIVESMEALGEKLNSDYEEMRRELRRKKIADKSRRDQQLTDPNLTDSGLQILDEGNNPMEDPVDHMEELEQRSEAYPSIEEFLLSLEHVAGTSSMTTGMDAQNFNSAHRDQQLLGPNLTDSGLQNLDEGTNPMENRADHMGELEQETEAYPSIEDVLFGHGNVPGTSSASTGIRNNNLSSDHITGNSNDVDNMEVDGGTDISRQRSETFGAPSMDEDDDEDDDGLLKALRSV